MRSCEIVIMEADKGKELCVSSWESYVRQGAVHTANDRVITRDEAEGIQKYCNGQALSWANILKVGANKGEKNAARCFQSLSTQSTIIPVLKCAPKTHKPVNEVGDPVTRPIVSATSCVNSRLGEMLADVIGAVRKSDKRSECVSTEDMLAQCEAADERIRQLSLVGGAIPNLMAASGDAVGLFTNIDNVSGPRQVRERFLKSTLEIDNVDYQLAGVYVACNSTRSEVADAGLSRVVPRRLHRQGVHPGATTKELTKQRYAVGLPEDNTSNGANGTETAKPNPSLGSGGHDEIKVGGSESRNAGSSTDLDVQWLSSTSGSLGKSDTQCLSVQRQESVPKTEISLCTPFTPYGPREGVAGRNCVDSLDVLQCTARSETQGIGP